ncbi:hypothetical protein ScalyP_jg5421 [Parmales sp. scaly parma]|nr:hypothetical protein ScalyP_jg5421 [Parmales sp. scaly parma]|tara:strand:+ start:129 stop:698 length:570 start_codon:yes stop_codon:yes gene_type:complete
MYQNELTLLRDRCGAEFQISCESDNLKTEESVIELCKRTTSKFKKQSLQLLPVSGLALTKCDAVSFAYDNSNELEGLLRDMEQIVSIADAANADADFDASLSDIEVSSSSEDDANYSRPRRELRKRLRRAKSRYNDSFKWMAPKWERRSKLLVKNLVKIGINFVQGSFALRSLRKAADHRDKTFPKFPI